MSSLEQWLQRHPAKGSSYTRASQRGIWALGWLNGHSWNSRTFSWNSRKVGFLEFQETFLEFQEVSPGS